MRIGPFLTWLGISIWGERMWKIQVLKYYKVPIQDVWSAAIVVTGNTAFRILLFPISNHKLQYLQLVEFLLIMQVLLHLAPRIWWSWRPFAIEIITDRSINRSPAWGMPHISIILDLGAENIATPISTWFIKKYQTTSRNQYLRSSKSWNFEWIGWEGYRISSNPNRVVSIHPTTCTYMPISSYFTLVSQCCCFCCSWKRWSIQWYNWQHQKLTDWASLSRWQVVHLAAGG